MKPRFAPDSVRRCFCFESHTFMPEPLWKAVYPMLKKIRVPALWVGRGRFQTHVQILPEHMPWGRESSLALRVVTVHPDGRLTAVVGRSKRALTLDARGVLYTGVIQ